MKGVTARGTGTETKENREVSTYQTESQWTSSTVRLTRIHSEICKECDAPRMTVGGRARVLVSDVNSRKRASLAR